jgi:hypothetical protein
MFDATGDPGGSSFVRRSESLGRAIGDLLTGVPDAGPAEQAAHVRQVTERLTEDWQAPESLPRAETCIGCGDDTDMPTFVNFVEASAGAGMVQYACPGCAPRYAA